MFHFLAHAFFKALLFLAAGAVILAQHHEQNMFKMGGLRKALPAVFWTFLIGAGALSAIPLITVGFYSKEWILWGTWQSPSGGVILWLLAGSLGVFLTAVYAFRMVFVTFLGDRKAEITHRPGVVIMIPLVVLAVLSIGAGFIQTPETLGGVNLFASFLGTALPAPGLGTPPTVPTGRGIEGLLQIIVSLLTLAGVGVAYLVYRAGSRQTAMLAAPNDYRGLRRFLFLGLGFDWVFNVLFVIPFTAAATFLRRDFIDYFYRLIAVVNLAGNAVFGAAQNGRVRWYLAGIGFGTVVAVGAFVFWGVG